MIRKLLVVLFVLGFAGPAWGQLEWDVAPGFEAQPPGTQSLGLADDRQRETKVEVRARGESEHCWGTGAKAGASCDGAASIGSNSNDNGRHRLGSARAFLQDTEPATLEVTDYNFGGGAGDNILDDGRIWFDQNDNYRMWVHDETIPDFELVTADDEVLAGADSLTRNGGFEEAGRSGDPANACAPCATGTIELPIGWDTINNNGIDMAYANPSLDVLYGDGYSIAVEANGANEGLYQTLTALPNGATYKIIFRADDDGVGNDDCRVTAVGSVSAGLYDSGVLDNNVWTTTEGEFTTGALEDVVINLLSVNNTDLCRWDHVNVYRIDDPEDDRPEISQPGGITVTDTLAAQVNCDVNWAGACANILSVSVTPPGPGYSVMVRTSVQVDCVNDADCIANVQIDDGVQRALGSMGHRFFGVVTLVYAEANLATGVTRVFTTDVQEGGPGDDVRVNSANSVNYGLSVLEAILIPTR